LNRIRDLFYFQPCIVGVVHKTRPHFFV